MPSTLPSRPLEQSPCTVSHRGGGGVPSLAPKSHGDKDTEERFPSSHNAVIVERSGLGPSAYMGHLRDEALSIGLSLSGGQPRQKNVDPDASGSGAPGGGLNAGAHVPGHGHSVFDIASNLEGMPCRPRGGWGWGPQGEVTCGEVLGVSWETSERPGLYPIQFIQVGPQTSPAYRHMSVTTKALSCSRPPHELEAFFWMMQKPESLAYYASGHCPCPSISTTTYRKKIGGGWALFHCAQPQLFCRKIWGWG